MARSPLSRLSLACGIGAIVVFGVVGLVTAAGVFLWLTPAPPGHQRVWVFARLLTAFGALGAVVGSVVGLVWGLGVYPPTAWFAGVEIGLVGAGLGVLLGALAGGAAVLALTVKVQAA